MVQLGIFDHIEGIPGTDMGRLLQDRLELIRMADKPASTLPPRRTPWLRPVHGAQPRDLPRRGSAADVADPTRPADQDPSPPSSAA